MYLGIREKIILVHLLLLTIVVVGLSIQQYKNQWELAKLQSFRYHKNISQRLISSVSPSIAGNNYANITLPVFTRELKNTTTLIYFEVDALSDNKDIYQIAYQKDIARVWRKHYPINYEQRLLAKIKKFKVLLGNKNTDSTKLQFLLNRAKDELARYNNNMITLEVGSTLLAKVDVDKSETLNTDMWLLSLTLPSINKQGGQITFVYDVSDLSQINTNILNAIIVEFIIALALSSILLIAAAHWVIKPIEKLTQCMSSDIKDIDPEKIPSLKKRDEIGKLARKFRALIYRVNLQIKEIGELSIKDPLTGLYNRRYYSHIVKNIKSQATRGENVLSFIYIDIDNFKRYNDHYGHGEGDKALRLVAQELESSVSRVSDICFRLGGEEFLIVAITTSIDDAYHLAERVRKNIELLNIKHEYNDSTDHLTVSIGLCSIQPLCNNVNIDQLLEYADKELYQVKNSGRNHVSQCVIGQKPFIKANKVRKNQNKQLV